MDRTWLPIIVEQNLLLCVSFSVWGRCFGFWASQISLTVGISMSRSCRRLGVNRLNFARRFSRDLQNDLFPLSCLRISISDTSPVASATCVSHNHPRFDSFAADASALVFFSASKAVNTSDTGCSDRIRCGDASGDEIHHAVPTLHIDSALCFASNM